MAAGGGNRTGKSCGRAPELRLCSETVRRELGQRCAGAVS